MTAIKLYNAGFTPLVSVIPPNASLAPSSRIQPSQLGKTPGLRLANGTWVGYKWLNNETTRVEVEQWERDGANVGILAADFPGVDIDSLDPTIASQVAMIARRTLGDAPCRTGKAPKRLLMYRTEEPFARMAIIIRDPDGVSHLIEVLGTGRQYLVEGMHPSGVRYTWDETPDEFGIDRMFFITRELVENFFDSVEGYFEAENYTVERVGDGKLRDRSQHQQSSFLAPSMSALRECVDLIPNSDDLYPGREEYIKMGYAIRAASVDDYDEGFEVFASWCVRHEADGRVSGNPETWRTDWGRMHPPFAVGWEWLTEQARPFGFGTARFDFHVQPLAVLDAEKEAEADAPQHSDAWLADLVVTQRGDQIRFVASTKMWYVWDGSHWAPDATMLAEHLVGDVLREQAVKVSRVGATEKEKQASARLASKLCSTQTHKNTLYQLRSDPRVAITHESFDHNGWIVNTPGGIVDLKTGELIPSDPEELCSRITLCAPDADMPSPVWDKFLKEVTSGNAELEGYLQRLAGYALSGSTEEQMLAFIWGPGLNGKGYFVNALMGVMNHYAQTATMDTFTASKYKQHPTNIAGLAGSRLVSATETERGSRWDEQQIKSLTGGDPIRTRFIAKNFFTFVPQFTFIFVGNHRPEIRDIDYAIKRRLQIVPFTFTPETRDNTLPAKFLEEGPAILQWMIEGCLEWQRQGLNPPAVVREATAEYFEEEDPIGRWLEQECVLDDKYITPLTELYYAWQEWAGEKGEYVGSMKSFSQMLRTKRFHKIRLPTDRRVAFVGIVLTGTILEELL